MRWAMDGQRFQDARIIGLVYAFEQRTEVVTQRTLIFYPIRSSRRTTRVTMRASGRGPGLWTCLTTKLHYHIISKRYDRLCVSDCRALKQRRAGICLGCMLPDRYTRWRLAVSQSARVARTAAALEGTRLCDKALKCPRYAWYRMTRCRRK